jgi:hypothetical protein
MRSATAWVGGCCDSIAWDMTCWRIGTGMGFTREGGSSSRV